MSDYPRDRHQARNVLVTLEHAAGCYDRTGSEESRRTMLDAEERILRAFDALASPSPSSAPDPGGLRERVEALLRAHDEHRQRGEAYPVTWVGAEIDALRALASAPGAAPEGDDK